MVDQNEDSQLSNAGVQPNASASPTPTRQVIPYLTATATIFGTGVALAAVLLFAIQWTVNSITSSTLTSNEDLQNIVQEFERDIVQQLQLQTERVQNETERLIVEAAQQILERDAALDIDELPPRTTPPDPAYPQQSQAEAAAAIELLPTHDFADVIYGRTVTLNTLLQADNDVYIVAELLDMTAGGGLKAPNITVIAGEVNGGRLDVSGFDGTALDGTRNGSTAGSINIATGSLRNTELIALGGSGQNGGNGDIGSSGRRGSCDGFGNWRAAQRGGRGEPGQDGGNGGAGGHIAIWYSDTLEIQRDDVTGGSPGLPGQGGTGGPGGRGCVGLGGAQEPAANGLQGAPGQISERGAAGTYQVTHTPTDAITREFARIESMPTPETIRYALYCLRTNCPE